jgi:16S rRNA (adenine1518-N6/adenine1519-N6)-dimethyltransferase
MNGPAPKKGLGQNFLADKNIAQSIVRAIDSKPEDVIMEIGPGRGTLTRYLLDRDAQVYAIEIDERLLDPLRAKFGDDPHFHLIHGDFIRLPWEDMIPDVPFRLVGNLPYHIASSVIFRCLDYLRETRTGTSAGGRHLQSWLLMVQKEVAQRIVAKPGSTDYSILTFFCALEGTTEIVSIVPANAFYPRPKVDGAVIRFLPYKKHYEIADWTLLNRLVRGAYSVRRKMLRNSLKNIAGVHPFWQNLDFDFTRRPETVTVEEWVELANQIAHRRKHMLSTIE